MCLHWGLPVLFSPCLFNGIFITLINVKYLNFGSPCAKLKKALLHSGTTLHVLIIQYFANSWPSTCFVFAIGNDFANIAIFIVGVINHNLFM